MDLNILNVDLFQNFLGVIFESENDANCIQKILQELHGYVLCMLVMVRNENMQVRQSLEISLRCCHFKMHEKRY